MSDDLREQFRQAAAELVAPGAAAADAEGRFNRPALRELGRRGLLRAAAPHEFGGRGLGLRGAAAAIEGLVEGSDDLGFAVAMMAHWVATQLFVEHASAAQRARWLPRLLSGEWLAGVANSEPRAGTDVMGLRTRARPGAAGFLLSGRKRSITNVGEADLLLVSARISGAAERDSIHAFALELPSAGAHVRPIRDLTGLRSSPTGDLLLRGVAIAKDALVDPVGGGVALFRQTFSWERLLCGYVFLATLRRARQRALAHAEERQQFGQAIGRNQYVQERIVRIHVAEQLLSAHLATTLDAACAGSDVFGALSVIKIYGLEAALDAAQSLVQILGGRGLRRQAAAEKMLRDVMTLSVFGDTVELHKSIAYGELVRQRTQTSTATPPAEPEIELVRAADVSAPLAAELTALVAEAFPARPELRGRYYFDAPPDELLLARRGGKIIGFRAITYREVQLGEQRLGAAGIGIAVAPREQRKGLGTRLTLRALERLRARNVALVLAFLFTPAAAALLRAAGFRELRARIQYRAGDSGELVQEAMPCYALALNDARLLDSIEVLGGLDLGLGTF